MSEPTQPPPDRSRDATVDEAQPYIDRIDRLTEAGRVNWFALMAYLVFAFITVLGVQDVDFFDPSRQTQLPLVNVSIPTEAFFTFAPVLGVALYVYLHLYVRKATGALCNAPARIAHPNGNDPTPLEEYLKPWLLNDMVLRWRKVGAVAPRPLDGLATATVIALIWVAGPFVLFGMWVRSWPAHNEIMTSLTGACLALALYAGHVSWVRMTRDLAGRPMVFTRWDLSRLTLIAALAGGILWLGWTKTESGIQWDQRPEQTASMTGALTVFVRTLPNLLEPNWWTALTPARLAEVQFAALPPGEADPTAARHRFRDAWCNRHGMEPKTCGRTPGPGVESFPEQAALRQNWCDLRGYYDSANCEDRFDALEAEFTNEWKNHRTATLAALEKPDLRAVDLRGADLSNAALTGVILRRARLQSADLSSARMEGADLSRAQMEGANLRFAQIEGIFFVGAQMEGTDLGFARMNGANLWSAQMEGANLSFAQMEGANLSNAQMEGANLERAQMEGADLSMARIDGAVLSGAQMEGADLSRAQMEGVDLSFARMNGADLRRARMDGANLWMSQLEGADLSFARMNGADLRFVQMPGAALNGAQMQRAALNGAQVEGAVLWRADLRSASWTEAQAAASLVQGADMRGGRDLPQGRLWSLIGNAATLLPENGDHHVCTCWKADPPGLEHLMALFARYDISEEELRDPDGGYKFFCEQPMRTGTPWPLDAPTPWEEAGLSQEEWMALPEQQPTVPCDPETWADAD